MVVVSRPMILVLSCPAVASRNGIQSVSSVGESYLTSEVWSNRRIHLCFLV